MPLKMVNEIKNAILLRIQDLFVGYEEVNSRHNVSEENTSADSGPTNRKNVLEIIFISNSRVRG